MFIYDLANSIQREELRRLGRQDIESKMPTDRILDQSGVDYDPPTDFETDEDELYD